MNTSFRGFHTAVIPYRRYFEIPDGNKDLKMRAVSEGVRELKNTWNANLIRYSMKPTIIAAMKNIPVEDTRCWEYELEKLHYTLHACRAENIKVAIDLQRAPVEALNEEAAKTQLFWQAHTLDILKDFWIFLVKNSSQFADVLYGYDLYNEPTAVEIAPQRPPLWPEWVRQITKEIRRYDAETPVIFESGPWGCADGFAQDFPLLDDTHVIYSFHYYMPHAFTHQGLRHNKAQCRYPGEWNKERLRAFMKPAIDFCEKNRVRMYVGEFNVINNADIASALHWLRDAISIFEQYGWDWTYFTYNETFPNWDIIPFTDPSYDLDDDLGKNMFLRHLTYKERENRFNQRRELLMNYFSKNTFIETARS